MSDSWPRRRLLAILRGASEPLDAQQLAQITGQHVTTVRFHLDILTRESLVRQFQQPPRGRGRPRIGYRAVQRSIGYQDLAQALADQLGPDSETRTAAGTAAGRAWGAKLETEELTVDTVADAKVVTVAQMSELGFAPDRDTNRDTPDCAVVGLTACPLRDMARTHPDVVCGVHRGLLLEILERHGAAGRVDAELVPFVTEETCEVRLRRSPAALGTASDSAGAGEVQSGSQVRPQPGSGQPGRFAHLAGRLPASGRPNGPFPQSPGSALPQTPGSGGSGPQLSDPHAHLL